MRKLILVTGDLATGKSTFAKVLSERYGCHVFYKDSIKEVLGDTIGFSNREENLKLSKATMEIMIHLFLEHARLGDNFIMEANFKSPELFKIHAIACDNDYKVLTVVLRGDIDILHRRYLNRMNNEERHPVHLSTTFDKLDDFKAYVEKSRNEKIIGESIEILADTFTYQTDIEILSQIDEFMKST